MSSSITRKNRLIKEQSWILFWEEANFLGGMSMLVYDHGTAGVVLGDLGVRQVQDMPNNICKAVDSGVQQSIDLDPTYHILYHPTTKSIQDTANMFVEEILLPPKSKTSGRTSVPRFPTKPSNDNIFCKDLSETKHDAVNERK